MKKYLIHLLGGYTREDLPADVVRVTLVTKGGETLPIMKVNTNKRHSVNNTVRAFNVYKDDLFWGQLINNL